MKSNVTDVTDNRKQRFLNTKIGIEVEVEAVPHDISSFKGWVIKEDPSLRNNGYEFVTQYGIRVHHVLERLNELLGYMNKIRESNPELFDFNERTSIHVHVDISKYSMEEIRNIIIVYTLFEDSLFRIAGNIRKHNVFCVPIRYLAMSEIQNEKQFDRTILGWKKYCALNFTRAADIGTVEFRHMEGNSDIKRILTWVSVLAMMTDYCRTVSNNILSEEVLKLKYISHYHQFADQVFGPFSKFIEIVPYEFDQAVSDAKMFFNKG